MEKNDPRDICETCEAAFQTGLDDEPNKGHVWCSDIQRWKKCNGWCGCYRYDRELPSRGD